MKPHPEMIVCEHCDAVHQAAALRLGESAACVQCGARLYRHHHHSARLMLAMTITALVVFLLANVYPLMLLNFEGVPSQATLWGTFIATARQGNYGIVALGALMTFFAPLFEMLALLYVLTGLYRGRRPRYMGSAMRVLRLARPWSLVPVLTLGLLVATVRIQQEADVHPETGLIGFMSLTACLTIVCSIDPRHLWNLWQECRAP